MTDALLLVAGCVAGGAIGMGIGVVALCRAAKRGDELEQDRRN